MENVDDSYDVQFVKQVLVHPRDRLAQATKKAHSDNGEFVKQVSVHPRDRWPGQLKKMLNF